MWKEAGKELFARLKLVFGCDVRSLALFRIALGALLFIDLCFRAVDLEAYYTDFGMLPRHALLEKFWNSWFFSLHLTNGRVWFQALLFIVAGVFALMLLFGYRTKLAIFVSWILLISLQNRNPIILQGGDVLFRMLLFWALFLPLGAVYSVDAWQRNQRHEGMKAQQIFSAGTAGIFLQFVFLYVFAALLKTGKEWVSEGSAIYYALSLDQFTTPLGMVLYPHPLLLKFLTFGVLWFELIGPLLLFIPFFIGPLRTFVLAGFVLLQVGMGSTMLLGPFPWFATAALLPLIPGWLWNSISVRLPKIQVPAWVQRLPPSRSYSSYWKILLTILGIFFIIYMFLWNVQTLGGISLPGSVESLAYLTRIDQRWNMFAPFPLKEDGWYVIPGVLSDGEQVDVFKWQQGFSDTDIDWSKPHYAWNFYKNERWRKYLMNLWGKDNTAYRLYYGQYLCRLWNRGHVPSQQLLSFNITYVKEETLPDYQTAPLERAVLWQHKCFA